MSIQFVKPLDHKAILEKINKDIQRKKLNLYLLDICMNVLNTFQGKEITKRIKTAIKKHIGENYVVYYEKSYSSFYLKIWENWEQGKEQLIKHDNCFMLHLGYNDNPYIDIEKIKEHEKGYYMEKERIENLTKGLSQVDSLCNSWNLCIKELQNIHEQAEKYELEYTFDLDIRR